MSGQADPRRGWFGALAYLLIACGLVVLALQARSAAGHVGGDFRIFHQAALRFSQAPLALYPAEAHLTLQGFLYPPPSILLFLPFSLFGVADGYALFVVLIYACAAGALMMWLRAVDRAGLGPVHLTGADQVAVLVLGLASGPVLAVMVAGQVDSLVLCLCITHVVLLRSGRGAAAGAVLAVGFWIKIYPALLLAYALWTPGRNRVAVGFAAVMLAVPVLALPVVPAELYGTYFLDLMPALSGRTIVNIYNQSAAAFLTRLDLPIGEALRSYDAFLIRPTDKLSILAAALAGIVLMARHARRPGGLDLVVAASLIAMIGPVAPLGWGHTYVYVLPLLVVTLALALKQGSATLPGVIAALFATICVPAYHRMPFLNDAPPLVQNLVYSRYLLVTLVLLGITWRLVYARDRRRPGEIAGAVLQGRQHTRRRVSMSIGRALGSERLP